MKGVSPTTHTISSHRSSGLFLFVGRRAPLVYAPVLYPWYWFVGHQGVIYVYRGNIQSLLRGAQAAVSIAAWSNVIGSGNLSQSLASGQECNTDTMSKSPRNGPSTGVSLRIQRLQRYLSPCRGVQLLMSSGVGNCPS